MSRLRPWATWLLASGIALLLWSVVQLAYTPYGIKRLEARKEWGDALSRPMEEELIASGKGAEVAKIDEWYESATSNLIKWGVVAHVVTYSLGSALALGLIIAGVKFRRVRTTGPFRIEPRRRLR